ncbi:hypothetical protein DF268_43590 [Streptomyces sp. V2]|uniref:Uncharacterized protein n=1 Tax=Streptomyces niveiscabiei TaxID=164115 RepID=A0ABW9I935_9ACTN|nr:hypothetical protein [Streptomyces sp. V2]PWG07377.1 hypothetical protein DF268_43590 [Streptomyces sp. V2]
MITARHIGREVTDGERRGILQTVWLGRAWVRPDGGGIEWDALPGALFTVEEREAGADVEQPV